MTALNRELLVEASLLAGRIMLENGAETSRVEDTLERMISNALGKKKEETPYTYITVNGIFVRLDQGATSFTRVDSRDHNLEKVTKVNQISRSFAANELTLEEVNSALLEVDAEKEAYPRWLKLLCTAGLSGSVMLIFGGNWNDLPAAMIAGFVCYATYLIVRKWLNQPFVTEYIAALVGGITAYIINLWLGSDLDSVMIGTVCPLVPGIIITNGIRDLMAKHYLSGLIRGLEGFLIALALGSGVATVYYIFIM